MFRDREREREKKGCLNSVGTYLPCTVMQGASCLSGVEIYLPALCWRCAGCLSDVRTYLLGTVLQGCRLFQRYWNLPAWHCVAVVQAV